MRDKVSISQRNQSQLETVRFSVSSCKWNRTMSTIRCLTLTIPSRESDWWTIILLNFSIWLLRFALKLLEDLWNSLISSFYSVLHSPWNFDRFSRSECFDFTHGKCTIFTTFRPISESIKPNLSSQLKIVDWKLNRSFQIQGVVETLRMITFNRTQNILILILELINILNLSQRVFTFLLLML